MTTSTAYCESVPASVLHAEISKLGVEHLLIVPDTHQKTLLKSLKDGPGVQDAYVLYRGRGDLCQLRPVDGRS